ncbi:serine carboxypeptidase-like 26 [Miscanthus floridulus]|uniref:serine carboxypeptidase-like 26 n=1 Tax=Miscanthus floridulus TaxID=154761 RepID=UPI00345A043E
MSLVYTQYDKIDIYNVYAPKCNTDESALSSSSKNTIEKTAKKFKRLRMFSGYDLCYSIHNEDYLNRIDVQKSLHANVSGWIKDRRWSICSDSVFDNYYDTIFTVRPIYSKLVKTGLRVWVYSGDMQPVRLAGLYRCWFVKKYCWRKILFQLEIYDHLRQATAKRTG